jgi:peptidoglycan/xylan/chitin deacetylase (PgdA/CDA1 family)
MRKKELLAGILCSSGAIGALRLHRRSSLTVFNYHRIRRGRLATPFDAGVFGPSVEMFELQMRWLKESADVVSEADVLDLARSGRPIPGRCAMVTFDDGYIDNYELAFPVLRALDLPAIFFIPTRSIEQRTLGWWDIISYLVKRCAKDRVIFRAGSLPTASPADRAATIRQLLRLIKSTRGTSTEQVLNELSRACEVELPARDEQSSQLMTWEQIEEMSGKNMAVGSHTHSHGVLSTMDEEAQLSEMKRSKEILEARLHHEVRSLSYPVGGDAHFTGATKDAAHAAGYVMAFSFRNRVNRRRIRDPFDIKRISPPEDLSVFKAVTVIPTVFL